MAHFWKKWQEIFQPWQRRKRRAQLKERLIPEFGSSVRSVAVRAAEELRQQGWLQDGSLTGGYFPAANLAGADLSGAYLQRTNLRAAKLAGADLARANFEGAYLYIADLEGANLRGARLQGADLRSANLRGADLQEAHLEGAALVYAHLGGASLRAAHLESANLRAVHLERADLRDALGLTHEQLNAAYGHPSTKLPSELMRPAHWLDEDPQNPRGCNPRHPARRACS